jgi:hypothetical protein
MKNHIILLFFLVFVILKPHNAKAIADDTAQIYCISFFAESKVQVTPESIIYDNHDTAALITGWQLALLNRVLDTLFKFQYPLQGKNRYSLDARIVISSPNNRQIVIGKNMLIAFEDVVFELKVDQLERLFNLLPCLKPNRKY